MLPLRLPLLDPWKAFVLVPALFSASLRSIVLLEALFRHCSPPAFVPALSPSDVKSAFLHYCPRGFGAALFTSSLHSCVVLLDFLFLHGSPLAFVPASFSLNLCSCIVLFQSWFLHRSPRAFVPALLCSSLCFRIVSLKSSWRYWSP